MDKEDRRNSKKTAVLALMMALVLFLSACAPTPFRLHVVANSDTEADQQVKLKVRDAVLALTAEGLLECSSAQEAEEYIEENLEIIEETANKTLADNSFDYQAKAQVGTFHFPERTYRDITYPEGDYHALRITLGEGEGQNWWCVMFPPLCLTEVDVLTEDETTEVEYTSFFVELFIKLFG